MKLFSSLFVCALVSIAGASYAQAAGASDISSPPDLQSNLVRGGGHGGGHGGGGGHWGGSGRGGGYRGGGHWGGGRGGGHWGGHRGGGYYPIPVPYPGCYYPYNGPYCY